MRLGFRTTVALALAVTAGACQRGSDWVRDASREPRASAMGDDAWASARATDPSGAEPSREQVGPPELRRIPIDEGGGASDEPAASLRKTGPPPPLVPNPKNPELYRNTYYDFPVEERGGPDATIYDASCAPIAVVSQSFHDAVCVQGSGQLASGVTVSFAKRGCECAAVCPRTGQKICFERLDPARFPHGRGATGKPIQPLRTLAVDSRVIPLGSVVFIPELVGLPRPDGTAHDGCFVAEDRGVRVVGRQVDVFTGSPALTARYNAIFPSNKGVHVVVGDKRCERLRASR